MKDRLSVSVRLHYNEAAGTYYLFCVDSGARYRVNQMGYAICMMLQEGKNRDAIKTKILETWSSENGFIEKDIDDFFNFLLKNHLIHA